MSGERPPRSRTQASQRARDIAVAIPVLLLTSPVLVLTGLAIRLSSPGPVLYRAPRVGRLGRPFTMLKFRTMRADRSSAHSRITAVGDIRVFPLGAALRRCKLDELPQLVNVLRGEMSIVGPRPEDPDIVASAYRAPHWETLEVLPGLTSPGSIFGYTHGESLIGGDSAEAAYVERLLEVKLALDTVYVRRAGLRYDARIIGRTAAVILAMLAGKRRFATPPEMEAAMQLVAEWRQASPAQGWG